MWWLPLGTLNMYAIALGVSRTSLSALFTPEVGSSSHAYRHWEHFQNRVSVQSNCNHPELISVSWVERWWFTMLCVLSFLIWSLTVSPNKLPLRSLLFHWCRQSLTLTHTNPKKMFKHFERISELHNADTVNIFFSPMISNRQLADDNICGFSPHGDWDEDQKILPTM